MPKVKIVDILEDKISGEWGEEPLNGEGVKVLRTTNFTNEGYVSFDSVVKRKIDLRLVEKKRLKSGDTIIEKSGGGPKQPVGRVVFFDSEKEGPFLCNNFTAILRPRKEVYPKFFFYSLWYKHLIGTTLRFQNKTTGIINLKLERYLDEEINLPDLKIQKIVSDRLSQLDSALQKRRQANALTEQFLQSAFLEMFGDPVRNEKGWVVKTLDEVCAKITDGTHHSPENLPSGKFKYITAKNIKRTGFDFSNITYVDEGTHRSIYGRCNPEFGDVLYIKDGVTTGIATVNTLKEQFSMLSSVALFKLNSMIDSYYLRDYLNNSSVYERIRRDMGGAAITRLTIDKLRRIKITVPPENLQNEYAQLVNQIELLRQKQRESGRHLQELFNSLMQRHFD